tara:strand:- start:3264 stop:3623 length:360 start_codon:yes stop_codon:yes gene_type:complete
MTINVLAATSIKPESRVETLGTGFTTISDIATSDEVLKCVSIYLANKTTSTANVTIQFVTSGGSAKTLAKEIDIPPDSTLQFVTKDAPIYLEEGEYLRALSGTASAIDLCSFYEMISVA